MPHLQDTPFEQVNLTNAQLLDCTFTSEFGHLMAMAFSPDGEILVAGSSDGMIHIWRVEDNQQIAQLDSGHIFVWTLAFSPDGRLLVSGGVDKKIRLWDISRPDRMSAATPLLTLNGHEDTVRTLAFSPDGHEMVSGSEDYSIRFWDVQSPWDVMDINQSIQLRQVVNVHHDRVFKTIYSSNGRYVASAGADQHIYVWDRARAALKWTLHGHTDRIAALTFSHDSQTLISGGVDTQIRLWNMNTGVCNHILEHHENIILSVSVSPDGRMLASTGYSGSVRLWHVDHKHGYHPTRILNGPPDVLWNAIFHPKKPILASSGGSSQLRLWHTIEGYCLSALTSWRVLNNTVDFAPVRSLQDTESFQTEPYAEAVIGTSDGRLRFWDVTRPGKSRFLTENQTHDSSIATALYSQTAPFLATLAVDNAVHIWSTTTSCINQNPPQLTLLRILSPLVYSPCQIAISPNGHWLVVASHSGDFFLWSLSALVNGQTDPIRKVSAHTYRIWSLAFSPDSEWIATGGDDHKIRLWHVAQADCIKEFGPIRGRIMGLAFSMDGKYLIMACGDDQLGVWEIATEELVAQLEAQQEGAVCVAALNHTNAFVSGGNDGSVRFWTITDQADGTRVKSGWWETNAHTLRANALSIREDDQFLASAGLDGTTCLWDVQSGTCIEVLHTPGPYEGTNIAGVQGITKSQKQTLLALGAVETPK
ncbi:MAG: WD40 repeat domain-containing protein [Chloroflexota bacterium]